MQYRRVQTKADIEFCKEAILAFRTNLNADTVVNEVFEMISKEGFELIYISSDDNKKAIAFTGYRVIRMLRTGPIIYIDDLYTLPEVRGKGYAGALLDHVAEQATKNGINAIHLDSGYALHTAHRLYLNKGYVLACNHFARQIA
ncbi:GNAT family N-acetyltransferase [Mucilaginibacter gynuensis]|uniref:GNAT family N-acetyltransferase n=1 Tax=Mucilaginibacter gynuensis TaxID=1302236 RepID=A0ABP8FVW5_9SPHI